MRWGWSTALALSVVLVCGVAAAQSRQQARQPVAPPKSLNPANDELVKLEPAERAARLAAAVGNWCIGTETLLMGVLTKGPGQGNAYWSLRCADGTGWVAQIDPQAQVTAIDCDTFKEVGDGKECFQKF